MPFQRRAKSGEAVISRKKTEELNVSVNAMWSGPLAGMVVGYVFSHRLSAVVLGVA